MSSSETSSEQIKKKKEGTTINMQILKDDILANKIKMYAHKSKLKPIAVNKCIVKKLESIER